MTPNQPLYASDLSRCLKISDETARRRINAVKEQTGYTIISVGDYIRIAKVSPEILGVIINQNASKI